MTELKILKITSVIIFSSQINVFLKTFLIGPHFIKFYPNFDKMFLTVFLMNKTDFNYN